MPKISIGQCNVLTTFLSSLHSLLADDVNDVCKCVLQEFATASPDKSQLSGQPSDTSSTIEPVVSRSSSLVDLSTDPLIKARH